MTLTALPVVRELPAEEWDRLLAFEPFASQGLPPQEVSRIIVAEIGGPGGDIVALWGLFMAIHAEPFWIHPDHRGRPGLIRRLWGGVQAAMRAWGAKTAFACIFDADAAQNVPLALRFGFVRMPGDLYFITIPEAPPVAEKQE